MKSPPRYRLRSATPTRNSKSNDLKSEMLDLSELETLGELDDDMDQVSINIYCSHADMFLLLWRLLFCE